MVSALLQHWKWTTWILLNTRHTARTVTFQHQISNGLKPLSEVFVLFVIEHCLADITFCIFYLFFPFDLFYRCLQQPWKKDGVCNMSKRWGLCSERLTYRTVCIDKMEVLTRYLTWPGLYFCTFFFYELFGPPTGFDWFDNGNVYKALYLGCYQYGILASTGLPNNLQVVYNFTSAVSVDTCVTLCQQDGHKFVALGSGGEFKHCLCGNKLKTQVQSGFFW